MAHPDYVYCYFCKEYFRHHTVHLPSYMYWMNEYKFIYFWFEKCIFVFCSATYVHQSSDGTSYVITSEPTSFGTNSSVSMTTISESNSSLVGTSETVDTTGIPLEQFTAHHTHQVDHEDHSTLFVLQDDAGGQDQEVWINLTQSFPKSSPFNWTHYKGFIPGRSPCVF